MRKCKDVIIPDHVEQGMIEAIDKFGVFGYELGGTSIIYVLMREEELLPDAIEAQNWLRERFPEFYWIAAEFGQPKNSTMLLVNSVWWEEGDVC